MDPPSITLGDDGLSWEVRLIRDGKPVTYMFGEHMIDTHRVKESEMTELDKDSIKGSSDADGYVYYLCAVPMDVGKRTFIWLTKEEALYFQNEINEIGEYSKYLY
jgi:hypothetical protein